jgi:ribonuclease HI
MPWQKMLFRGDLVWVHVADDGRPVLDGDGRAEMKYREGDTKTYRPGPTNLTAAVGTGGRETLPAAPVTVASARPRSRATSGAAPLSRPASGARAIGGSGPPDSATLDIWTDGACSGNPGPMGIGVVVIHGDGREEISEYLGVGTNNIAELVAIERGLEIASKRLAADTRRVRIHSDSSYAIGLLEKGWKAKANAELVARIRRQLAGFPARVEFVKVAGHAGIPENERCDELARMAIESRQAAR